MMNSRPTIGILSPGDMGHAVGARLQKHGLRVLTNLTGRSPRSVALAAEAGIIDVADDRALVQEADILLSILVPAEATACAERIATALRAAPTRLLFADCNAIAPRTVQSMQDIITAAGGELVDVGIIGGPPRNDDAGPRLYVSGPQAEQFAVLKEYGLDIRVLGSVIGQASGLKMCYASLTKGLTALATEALTAGKALGLDDALSAELQSSQPVLYRMFQGSVPAMPPKAYRWVGEMEEIAHTFADLGLPPQMLEGAAAIYRFVEQTELGREIPETRQRGQNLEEVTDILSASLHTKPTEE
jgi:3-hydroxyisobutyrate dehydrogenase-like beta-hydroxyacid dehydrogenase